MAQSLLVLAGKSDFVLPDYYSNFDIIKCNSIFEGALDKLDREIESRKLYKSILIINTDHIKKLMLFEENSFMKLLNDTNLKGSSIYTSRYNRTPYRYNNELVLNEIVIPSPYLFLCDSLTFNVLSSYREEEHNYIHDYRFQATKKPFLDNYNPVHFSFFNILNCMNIDINIVK